MTFTKVVGAGIHTLSNITSHNLHSSGIITAIGLDISGNATIGGVLTYEDVTSIDSVGIVTARAGVNVSGGQLEVGSNIKLGNAGVITATSFVGSGAALTGIDATSIKDSSGNVKIQAQASGAVHTGISTFSGEIIANSNLTTNGTLHISKPAPILKFTETDNSKDFFIVGDSNKLSIRKNTTAGANIVQEWSDNLVRFTENLDIDADLDVDGHTHLDNVSIAGVTTFSGTIEGNGGSMSGIHTVATSPNVSGQGGMCIGNGGSYRFIQSHGNQELRINPVGNDVKLPSGSTYIGSNYAANITNNANNRVITGGSNGVINGEAKLTFDGNNLRIDHGDAVDGILGEAYDNYFGLKHADQTQNSEYMILSQDAHTFISASSGSNVYIRYGGNDSTNQLIVGSGNDALTWRGNKIFHAGNDGSGSGLDADTLDGVQGSSFLRSDAEDTTSARLNLASNGQYPLTIDGDHDGKIVLKGSTNPYIRFQEGTTDKAYIQWHSSGKLVLSNQETNERLDIGSGSNGLQFLVDGIGRTVWHSGNDGSGSTLDADTVDGLQASQFLRNDIDNTISAKLTSKLLAFSGVGGNSNNSSENYAIYQQSGAWSNPFPDLIISYHTGIKIGGFSGYGGTRFYNDSPERSGATEIFSVGNGDNHVRVANNLYISGALDVDGATTLDGLTVSEASTFTGVVSATNDGNTPDKIGDFKIGRNVNSIGSIDNLDSFLLSKKDGNYTSGTKPSGTNNAFGVLSLQTHSGNYFSQLGFYSSANTLYIRSTNNTSSFSTWQKVWSENTDGAGSGLDADTLDGVQGSSFLRSDADDTAGGRLTTRDLLIQDGYHLQRSSHHTGHLEGGYNNIGTSDAKSSPIYTIGSNYNPSDAALSNMYGIGFSNSGSASFISFNGTGNWGMYVAADGDARVWLDGGNGAVSAKGHIYGDRFYCSLQTTRYLSDVTGNYGSIQINGSGNQTWEGYSIDGRFVFMHDGGDYGGLYNDVDNDWFVYCQRQGYVQLRHNDTARLETTGYGVKVDTTLLMNGGNIRRGNHHTGHLEGSYNNVGENSYKSNPIYTIGSGYNPTDAALSNMYGIGYSHTNASFINFSGASGWGMYAASDGDARIWLGAGNGVISAKSHLYCDRVYCDLQTTRFLSDVTGNYGSIQINGGGGGGWEGFSIDGRVVFMHNGSNALGLYNDVNNEWILYSELNSFTDIRYNGTWRGRADSDGFQINGHCYPASNAGHDLGKTANRWRNIYTNDLHLSNESKKDTGGNDVDGTWGDWTMQEGEDKLFMINNRTGKKYSILMKEEN